MSRKSLSAKKEILSWFYCENCKIYALVSDEKNHLKLCNSDCIDIFKEKHEYFVYENSLYAASLPVGVVETKLTELNSKNVIYLNESLMRLCSWKIGERVIVKCGEDGALQFVRTVWPLAETVLRVAVITREGKFLIIFI